MCPLAYEHSLTLSLYAFTSVHLFSMYLWLQFGCHLARKNQRFFVYPGLLFLAQIVPRRR